MSGSEDDGADGDDDDDGIPSRPPKLLHSFPSIGSDGHITVKKIYSNKKKPKDAATLSIHTNKYDIGKIDGD